MIKEAASPADLLRLMSEVLSLREQVAQAQLKTKRSKQFNLKAASVISQRRKQKRR